MKNGLSGARLFCCADPVDGLVRHVVHQVVALFGRLLRLYRRGAFVERRVPLIGLAADEPVEVFEAAAARGPGVERTGGARFPDRHLVALAELRRRVAVELQCARKRRHGVRQHGAVARRAGGNLGDAAHADGVVIAAGQQRLTRRRAQRRRVEAVELEPTRCQFFRGRCLARTAKRARRTEADVIDQNDQDVRSTLGWAQPLDRRELRRRILRIERNEALPSGVRHRKVRTMLLILRAHMYLLFS